MRNKQWSNMVERAKVQAAFVKEKIGTGIICKRCDATCATFADACTADLAEMCPGFIVIEDARSEFQRLAASGSLSGEAEMTDVELQALTVFVAHETAILNADVQKFGEPQWNPQTPSFIRLGEELHRRGKLQVDAGKQR